MDLTPLSIIVLQSIAAIARKYNTPYPHPSQAKLSQLLKDKHGVARSARTVRRSIAELVTKGYVICWQSKKTVEGIGDIYLANTYVLRPKAFALLGQAATRLLWILKKARRPFLASHTSLRSEGKQERPPSHRKEVQKVPLLGGILPIKTLPKRKSEEETRRELLKQVEMIKAGLVKI